MRKVFDISDVHSTTSWWTAYSHFHCMCVCRYATAIAAGIQFRLIRFIIRIPHFNIMKDNKIMHAVFFCFCLLSRSVGFGSLFYFSLPARHPHSQLTNRKEKSLLHLNKSKQTWERCSFSSLGVTTLTFWCHHQLSYISSYVTLAFIKMARDNWFVFGV